MQEVDVTLAGSVPAGNLLRSNDTVPGPPIKPVTVALSLRFAPAKWLVPPGVVVTLHVLKLMGPAKSFSWAVNEPLDRV